MRTGTHLKLALWALMFGLSLNSVASAQTQFGKMVVFGDSLSDGGAYTNFFRSLNLPGAGDVTRFRFTTNPGNVWVENIASRFGITLTPNALDGGFNYAEGGARVTLANPSVLGLAQSSVSVQIDRYLASGRTFEKNDIVTILAGANDVFVGGPAAIVPAASALAAQLSRLHAAGANNIILLNLPDIGLTPSFGAGTGPASTQGTLFSSSFNGGLKQSLQGFSGNVLYFDAFTLYREVVANRSAFGLTNVTNPACLTPSAGQCTPATTVPSGASSYLFADGVHPSTAGHLFLGDAVMGTLLAPSQISLLPLSVQSSARGQQLAYDERLRPQGGHVERTLELYGSAGYMPYKVDSSGQLNGVDTENKALTLGADYQLSPSHAVGIAVSETHADSKFGNESGGFSSKLTSLGIYGRGGIGSVHLFANSSYGWADMDDIRRDIHIGPAVRSESGSTSGSAAALKVGGGYDGDFGSWTMGPTFSLNYERIRLDGYAESGTSSTQLTFGSQTLSQLMGSAGLEARLADNSAVVAPYVRAAYEYDFLHDARSVSIQTQAAASAFQGAAFMPGRDAVSLTGGARFRLGSSVGATVNATGLFGQSDSRTWGLSGALAVRF